MGYLKVFAVVVLCAIFVLPVSAEPNNTAIVPVQATQPVAEQNTACAKPATQNLPILPNVTDETIRIARAEIERDAYKQAVEASQKSVELTKWVFTSMLTVFGFIMAIFGFVIYKETGKHKEAVAKADKAAENAQECEKKAENSLKEVRKLADEELAKIAAKATEALDDIKKRGEEKIKELLAEGNKQQQVSKLWNDALRLYNEGKYKEACDKYAKIVKIKPKDSGVYNNWGVALASLARFTNDEVLFNDACSKYAKAIEIKGDYYEAYCNWGVAIYELAKLKDDEALFREACSKYTKAIEMKADCCGAYYNWGVTLVGLARLKGDESLFKEACSKFAKAIEIKADDYEAYDGWGNAFLNLARLKIGTPEYDDMLNLAEEKCLKAEVLKKGEGAYNLACVYALRKDKDNCRKWLNVGHENGTLPTREHAVKDSDLDSVRDEEWFKAIKWEGEK